MARLRLVFVVVAALVLVPLLFLVRRALTSARAERALEQRAVADRVIDEMERELTAFLRREEDRPFSHYRHLAVPDDPKAGVALVRSPLAEPLAEPFVVGPFQVEPDGAVSSPLWPDDEKLAALVAGSVPPPERRAAAEAVVAAVADRFATPRFDPVAPEDVRASPPSQVAAVGKPAGAKQVEPPKGVEAQSAGTTVAVAEPKGAAPPETVTNSALEVLSQLNRGAEARKVRQSKVETTQSANVIGDYLELDEVAANEEASAEPEDAQQRDGTSAETQVDEAPAPPIAPPPAGDPAPPAPPADDASTAQAVAPAPPPPSPPEPSRADAVVDVRVEPMVGRRLDERRMVLYRTVLAGDRAFRQGLVIDVDALVAWLSARVLPGEAAGTSSRSSSAVVEPRVRIEPDRGDPDPPVAAVGSVFRHRFADPFGPAAALLRVETPSGSLGSAEIARLLAGLLVLAVVLGLLALYRMVAVAVRYAERRSDFVSAVTHELKTPLTAIRMYGEMLRDGIVPDEARRQRYYETITAEGERLSRLVENVLELARLERREKPARPTVGEVGPVLTEALAVLGPHAEKQGFSLRLEVEPGLPAARFDRDALLQVIVNLIDNAIKYARDASDKTVTLRARREDGAVVVTVADRGPGVAPRQLRKIFEPFWRGESELTRTTKGTGIGLALVRGLVARMGGAVTAANADAGGLEVRVRLAAA